MEVILREDIKGLGYKNDLVQVKAGYGNNFLIPRGYAVNATESAKKVVAENIKQAAHKADKLKKDAVATSEKIAGLALEIAAKVGDTGKIFGAVTSLQISDALAKKGIAVDRKKIAFKGDVKDAGEHTAVIDLHKEVKVELKFTVVAE